MSFFIPGRTTCSICGLCIENRWQAARLPITDPGEVPDLASLARGYVHRSCWQTWAHRSRFATSAMALVSRSRDATDPLMPVVEGDWLIRTDIPATKASRLEDLEALVTLDVAWADACRVANWLNDAAKTPSSDEMTVGSETWQLRPDGDLVELVRSQDGEPVDVVALQPDKVVAWARAVQKVCDRQAL